ncbi:hypothetical protein CGCSCA4_v003741 [Colletotrichum siamense]|uniref:BHLH domain-containing protein n=1 Tax=Colletotrichum siamense TaxID=690259 RepID=A0A9P5EZI2_COLSI|nr:hypothetical protein CGCSCA4_v003741 [Colletotrichum siamense]KAF4862638.1 hypothetical protein CGCSCA2_v003487 [Colletotrichum siamense]
MNTTAQDTVTPGPTATAPPETIPSKKAPKKRVRNFTADDRAAHRIFEKGRREAFKERLIELAANLPALADTDPQRLSKHVVIDESIARHKLLESRCSDALQCINSLLQEREELLDEVNNWRRNNGALMRQPRPLNVNMDAFAETERELRRRVALQLGRPTRKSSEQSGGPTDEHSQAGSSTNNQTDEAAQVPRVLPSEPTQDARAVSELNNLLLDTSWPEETESPSVRIFSGTVMESLAMPDQGTAMSSNAQSESMPVSSTNINDYQLLRGIDHDRQGMYQNGILMDFSSTGTPTFDGMDPSQVPISPAFLGPSVANQDLHFQQKQQHQHQQQQQWASWPG